MYGTRRDPQIEVSSLLDSRSTLASIPRKGNVLFGSKLSVKEKALLPKQPGADLVVQQVLEYVA